jgi:hypothetical protein
MKLDSPGAPHSEPLASEEWTMEMTQEANQYISIVKRDSTPMCRLSIVVTNKSEAEARTELAEKARRWIREYLERDAHPPKRV